MRHSSHILMILLAVGCGDAGGSSGTTATASGSGDPTGTTSLGSSGDPTATTDPGSSGGDPTGTTGPGPTTGATTGSTTADPTGGPLACAPEPAPPACDPAAPAAPPLFGGAPIGPTPFMVGQLQGTALGTPAIVDFDRDGDFDVVASTTVGVAVLLNDGSGQLTAPPSRSGSCCATDVVFLRTAGDCFLDAVLRTGTAADGNLAYRIQYGSEAGFGAWLDLSAPGLPAPADPVNLAGPFDLDGEQPDDLLLMVGSATYPLLGDAFGGFTVGPAFALELDLWRLPGLDLDGDGVVREAYCVHGDPMDAWEGACVLDQNGVQLPEGVVATDKVFLGLAPGRFADWDGDGDLDVIKQHGEAAGTGLWGFSTLDAATRLYVTGDPELFPGNAPIVADLDGDCRPDGVGFVAGAGQLAISYADGMGGYSDPELTEPGDTLRPVGAADMDGDGAVDIVAYYTGDDAIVVFRSGA